MSMMPLGSKRLIQVHTRIVQSFTVVCSTAVGHAGWLPFTAMPVSVCLPVGALLRLHSISFIFFITAESTLARCALGLAPGNNRLLLGPCSRGLVDAQAQLRVLHSLHGLRGV